MSQISGFYVEKYRAELVFIRKKKTKQMLDKRWAQLLFKRPQKRVNLATGEPI